MKIINGKKPLAFSAKTFRQVVITYMPSERFYLSIFWSSIGPLRDLELKTGLENRVKKPSYGLWGHKAELSQIVTSKLIFR